MFPNFLFEKIRKKKKKGAKNQYQTAPRILIGPNCPDKNPGWTSMGFAFCDPNSN